MKTVLVPKSKFKPRAFEYLRQVESGKEEICITDHGVPVAKIVSLGSMNDEELTSLQGLVVKYERPLDPVDIPWEAQS